MIPYPSIDPEIVRIGPFALRWYGLMYVIGFVSSYLLVRLQIRQRKLPLSADFLEGLYTCLVLGLLLGARLGYVLFYDLGHYLADPLEIFALWHGGMSFHGGLIGAVLAGVLYTRKHKNDPWLLADIIVVTAPIGLGFGRLGNFLNGELFGRVTDVPWAMIFPGETLPRHPSQLYECFLEGFVLFVVLWLLRGRFSEGVLTGVFLVLYGVFRSFAELFREPDPQVGFIGGFLTMGQVLSIVMIVAGLAVIRYRSAGGRPR